jgi:dTDP-4-dehydrorhamnose reductase
MKKIYISGAGGMLGEAFKKIFSDSYELRCTDIDLNSDWLSYCDIRNENDYSADVFKFQPDYLFHLGAITDLEYCEIHPDNAYHTNTLSVEFACRIANRLKIPLLYISTAGIFDGKKDVYDDWDDAHPIGVYARSKYLGELVVKEQLKNYLICRAGWMMGGGPSKDKKFINKIIRQIQAGTKELNVVNDKLGTPTYTIDFARNVKLLLDRKESGLYNMVCEGVTSRIDVLTELLSILECQNKIAVNQVQSDYFLKEYFAPRPDSERLINYKLNLKKLNIMRPWQISLKEYLTEYFHDLKL